MPAGLDITPEITQAICDRLIGGESLAAICRDESMPAQSTVYVRMAQDEAFRSAIAHAREAQQDAIVDEMIDLADKATVEDHNVMKLRIWARQWRASKLAPKKYGDRLNVDQKTEVTTKEQFDGSHLSKKEREVFSALVTKMRKGAE